jgi:hypothetical protein
MGAVVKDIAEASSSKDLDDNDVAEMAQKAAEQSA